MTNEQQEAVIHGVTVNKAALVEIIYEKHGIDRQTGKEFVETFFDLIIEYLSQGNTVKLPGLGNFVLRDKKSRPGRNLKTGETVMIDERRVVVFHPSATLTARMTENLLGSHE